jgi:hypothetical protein
VERTEGGRRLRVSVKVEPGGDVRQATLTVRAADGPGQPGEVLATVSGFMPLPVKDEPVPMAPTPDAAPDAPDGTAPGRAPPPELAP